jgi:iron-sulfur cluster repair protein YtfE (RIC family)
MDALDLLIGDHNRVRGLFARFEAAKESERTDEMLVLATKIFEELEIHTSIEEEIFYPATHDLSEDIGEVVDEGVQEHHVAKVLMEEIRAVEPGSDEWVAKMAVLIENVEHHAEEEESEMFPHIRAATEAAARKDLAVRLEARKAELGAPTLADTIDLTKEELMERAQDQEIPGRSSMSKDELAAAIDPR